MSEEITLKSGKVIQWHKCPRYILWGHGKTAHTFQLKAQAIANGEIQDPIERGLALFESLSEHERMKLQAFADDIVRNSTNENPDDLSEQDYWEIFGLTLYSSPDAPIETEDGETDAQSVQMFPTESIIQDSGESVSDVSSDESGAENGNP